MIFRNYKRVESRNSRMKHYIELVTDQQIDITNTSVVHNIAKVASENSPYHHLGYGLSFPEIVRYKDKGYYAITWWSAQSCD